MEKMSSNVYLFHLISAKARRFRGLYDDEILMSDVEATEKQPEADSIFPQPKKKCRKIQKFLCINSEYVNRINDWLGKDELTTIGIYGMGGIGKTALALHVYKLLKNSDIPSTNSRVIAWVTMEMDFTIYQLQKRIAAALGLDLERDKDVNRRAAMLYAYLLLTNNFILFIDNLWGDFRREDVGIPRNCKLIVITRLLDVCRLLHCQKTIKVEPLSEEENWQLFQHNIGGFGVSDSKQSSHDKKVVFGECAGLPLAITALANSMTSVTNASTHSKFSIESTQMEDLLNTLKLSYDRLNIKLKRCFLYCASYPKFDSISKEELIRLWIKEKLIDDAQLQAQYDLGHSILNKLLNSCLLESCQDKKSIKMNDLVRRMALSICKMKVDQPSNLELCRNFNDGSLINSPISPIH